MSVNFLPEKGRNENSIDYAIRCIETGFITSTNGLKPSITYGKHQNSIKHVFAKTGSYDFFQISSGNQIYIYHSINSEFYYIWITHELKIGWSLLDKYSIDVLNKEFTISNQNKQNSQNYQNNQV